ncbi:hypothetical protein M1KS0591p1_2655 [Staphylococcus aureus]|jgi:NADH-ubiquinone oxidoreductase chain 4|nr:hypothetical protein M1KS0591p1_2655 [Staphylococcus aureus]
MFLSFLLITPIIGALSIFLANNLKVTVSKTEKKITGLITSIVNLYNSLIVFILFDSSLNISQFVLLNSRSVHTYDLSLGVEGISIFFVLLITIIMPISVLSN